MKLFITKVAEIKTKVFAENVSEVIDILIQSEPNYYLLNNKLVYEFDDTMNEVFDVYINEIEIKKGIVR